MKDNGLEHILKEMDSYLIDTIKDTYKTVKYLIASMKIITMKIDSIESRIKALEEKVGKDYA